LSPSVERAKLANTCSTESPGRADPIKEFTAWI
jgi:hypothetical protein